MDRRWDPEGSKHKKKKKSIKIREWIERERIKRIKAKHIIKRKREKHRQL